MSVAPEYDVVGQSLDFSHSMPPPTQPPPKHIYREEPPSPELSESESFSSASIASDTIGQSVSEGQWLISHSEGQAPDFFVDEGILVSHYHSYLMSSSLSDKLRKYFTTC